MGAFNSTETSVFGYIATNWTLCNIEWPNVPRSFEGGMYVSVKIAQSAGVQFCFGRDTKNVRDIGEIVGELMVPAGYSPVSGGKTGSEIAEEFRDLLEQKTVGLTHLGTGRIIDAGLTEDKVHYRSIVLIPYDTFSMT